MPAGGRILIGRDTRASGASLVQAVGGGGYLVGGGASGYHDPDAFDQAGITVIGQQFQPLRYGNERRFIPGLSIIDYLMHDATPLTRARLTPA